MSKILAPEDRKFLRHALKYFNVHLIKLDYSPSKKSYPDIWISKNGKMPKITVTREWMKQNLAERHKRLVHELCHETGLEHSEEIGFNTIPAKDTFSKKVYADIVNGGQKFSKGRFGL